MWIKEGDHDVRTLSQVRHIAETFSHLAKYKEK